jgi:hypothetical protein
MSERVTFANCPADKHTSDLLDPNIVQNQLDGALLGRLSMLESFDANSFVNDCLALVPQPESEKICVSWVTRLRPS